MIENDRGYPILVVSSARLDAVRRVAAGDPCVWDGKSGLRIYLRDSSRGINFIRRHDAVVSERPRLGEIQRRLASHAYRADLDDREKHSGAVAPENGLGISRQQK